ncbi:MAG: SDR family oxidoreductase [Alphaproteobacteria bacterium]|nr:SDR family oxidoreductase [Alphaproteobacteria bacterium]
MSDVVIVTGASTGIGAATARLLGSQGASVVVNYNSSTEAAEGVVAEVKALGGKAIAVKANMGSQADIVRMFAETDAAFGPVTGLVNNAATNTTHRKIETYDFDEVMGVLAVNTAGLLICCREAVKRMSTKNGGKGGAIVNVSSMSADSGGIGPRIHYATTNGARRTFTFGLAKQSGPKGIRVNGVMPGVIDTHFNDGFGNDERNAELGPKIPIGRVGVGADIGETIVWLLSERASYVNGAVIPVNGGFF